ncbi:MAG: SGNH/GDSL hydrolase family protein [Gemmatimonadota bacterium]|jgi:lysophospholipase L1-like esterase
MHKLEGLLARVFLAQVAVIVSFVALEFGANVFLTTIASPTQFNRYASWRQLERRYGKEGSSVSPHLYLGHFPRPGWHRGANRHNALGYRGREIEIPKPSGEFRIVCLGGSTTYTSEVEDYRLSYPDQLEDYLHGKGYANVRVINGGFFNWTSWESLINFELRSLDLEPDLVLVYHGVNDVPERLVWPPEAYRGDRSGSKSANATFFVPHLLEYSTLARILLIKFGLVAPHSALQRVVTNRPPTAYIDEWQATRPDRLAEGQTARGFFSEVSPDSMISSNPPKYFRRNLENLVAIASYRGIDVVLATFAYQNLPVEEGGSPLHWAAIDEHNEVVRSLALATPAFLFDFQSLFPVDSGFFAPGGIHLNANGARAKARFFGDYLITNRLLGGN